MKFIFKKIDSENMGWFPEGVENFELTRNVTASMIAHDMIDHGIIAQGDYSVEGEHLAYGSSLWWNGRLVGDTPKSASKWDRLIKNGFELSRKRFPNKIIVPLEAQLILDKLLSTAFDEYRRFNHVFTSRFDIDVRLDGRMLRITTRENSDGINPRSYRLF